MVVPVRGVPQSRIVEARERRRHVRVKPRPELPARAALAGGGFVRETLHVVDVSVGGLALSAPALAGTSIGQTLKLVLIFEPTGEHAVDVVVRWISGDTLGVELVAPTPRTTQTLGRYVAEILERG